MSIHFSNDYVDQLKGPTTLEKRIRGYFVEHQRSFAIVYHPVFRVIMTWIWAILAPLLIAVMVVFALRIDLTTARQAFGTHPYLAVYLEILSAGFLPLVLTGICRESLSLYGLRSKGLVKSLIFSALLVVASYGFTYLTTGQWIGFPALSYHLTFPWNIWYALLGMFAYGPLEVFFVTWLITNTDRIFKSENARGSWGLIVTVLLFGLLHILVTQSLANALHVAVTFFLLGLIYKYTGNSIGPMAAWTLINGQVWFLAQLLWSL
jgi:membrane protease YdiL (CAAX protease family)